MPPKAAPKKRGRKPKKKTDVVKPPLKNVEENLKEEKS